MRFISDDWWIRFNEAFAAFENNKTFCPCSIWLWCRETIDSHSKETFMKRRIRRIQWKLPFDSPKHVPSSESAIACSAVWKKTNNSWINWKNSGKFSLNMLVSSSDHLILYRSVCHDLTTSPNQTGLLSFIQFDAHGACPSIHWVLETILVERTTAFFANCTNVHFDMALPAEFIVIILGIGTKIDD